MYNWTKLNKIEVDTHPHNIMSINESLVNACEASYESRNILKDFTMFNEKADAENYTLDEYISEAFAVRGPFVRMFKNIGDRLEDIKNNIAWNIKAKTDIRTQAIAINNNKDKVESILKIYDKKGIELLNDKSVKLKEYEVDEHILKAKAVLATHTFGKFMSMTNLGDSKTSLSSKGMLDYAEDMGRCVGDILFAINNEQNASVINELASDLVKIKNEYLTVYKLNNIGYNYGIIMKRSADSYFIKGKEIHPHIGKNDLKMIYDMTSDEKLLTADKPIKVLKYLKEKFHESNKDTIVSGESLLDLTKTYRLCTNIIILDSQLDSDSKTTYDVGIQDTWVSAMISSVTKTTNMANNMVKNIVNSEIEEAVTNTMSVIPVLSTIINDINDMYLLLNMTTDILTKDFHESMKRISNSIDRFNLTDSEKLNLVLILTAGVGLTILAL